MGDFQVVDGKLWAGRWGFREAVMGFLKREMLLGCLRGRGFGVWEVGGGRGEGGWVDGWVDG